VGGKTVGILVKQVSKRYGSTIALREVNLFFEKDRIYGLYGEMGSGKSTLLKAIAGLIDCDAGFIELSSRKNELSFLDQDKGLYNELTVIENLQFWKGVYKKNAREIKEVVQIFEMSRILSKRVSELSEGNQQMVALATALLNKFKVLILDEPTVSLDVKTKQCFYGFLKKNQGDSIIIMSSHNIEEIMTVCTDLIQMEYGKILSTRELR
jgi:ABC-2 type transport system ATP-binding protein